MKNLLNKINWLKTGPVLVAAFMLTWAVGCQPTVQSLRNPERKVTGPQLQVELDSIIAQFDIRKASLEEQTRLRQLILQNALRD